MVAVPGFICGNMSSTLDQLSIHEERLVAYPLSRRQAACLRWAAKMKVALSKHGCAHALSTAAYELDELSDSQRVANEKIYGSLLGDKGCLRKQP